MSPWANRIFVRGIFAQKMEVEQRSRINIVSKSVVVALGCVRQLSTGLFVVFAVGVLLGCRPDDSRRSISLDRNDKQKVEDFYYSFYEAASGNLPTPGGEDLDACDMGSSSFLYDMATLLRVEYYRTMAGLPEAEFSEELSVKCRAAALIMAANYSLSHYPTEEWHCYTEAGAEAASHSNLYLGVEGPAAVDGYIEDPGADNYNVGHRRWVLYSQLHTIGTGSVGGANALWVINSDNVQFMVDLQSPFLDSIVEEIVSVFYQTPVIEPRFVTWPPSGYVPGSLAYDIWSISYPDADFTDAFVSMTCNGVEVPFLMMNDDNDGYGDSSMMWQPDLSGFSSDEELHFSVRAYGVKGIGFGASEYSYNVTTFKPGADPYAASTDASAPASKLSWVYPFSGSTTTSTDVALFGRNIGNSGVKVLFGEQGADIIEQFDNALHVVAPPQVAGPVTVSVLINEASVSLEGSFTYK
jgi:hypothetical protein